MLLGMGVVAVEMTRIVSQNREEGMLDTFALSHVYFQILESFLKTSSILAFLVLWLQRCM